MSNTSILDLQALYPYLLNMSLRESPLLESLRQKTAHLAERNMQISPEQGQFLALLIKLTNTRKAIEIGTFTGYSSLCIAKAMPADGKLTCCDMSKKWTDIARSYWQEADVEHKIQLHLQPAADTLEQILKQGEEDTFDFAFIDADKSNYDIYYEKCLKLLKPGGLMMIDNVLWGGAVIDENDRSIDTLAIRAFNLKLKDDKRIDLSLLPMADGITLARKRNI